MLRQVVSRRVTTARPRAGVGLLVAALAVAATTAAIYALKQIAPAGSLSVVYLPAVLLVSVYWGLTLGLATSLLSAAAFNFFHIPPVGRFTIANSRNWVALAAFMIVAAVVSAIADLARGRAREADRRRAEADLAAALARELLAESATADALAVTARRIAEALAIPSASIVLGPAPVQARRRALPLSDAGGIQLATLVVPDDLPAETYARLHNEVVPALAALVAIALRRDALQQAAVETAALRRSDDVKTALLRAVSHDLRTPLTAIVAAGHALGTESLSGQDRSELSAAVVVEAGRLASLVEKLLDLSKLQAGRAEPHRDWVSLEDLVLAASDGLPHSATELRLSIDPEVPLLCADAAQLERAFANLIENAQRYAGGQPVSINIRRTGSHVLLRIVDRGPGIGAAELERIFEPFYRGSREARDSSSGSGLGLAIAKGFVEANGGSISVESLPGQGTSFIVSLPLAEDMPVPVGT